MKHIGLFAAGVLFGTAGLKILGSKDAKKVYAHTTAAVLRAKDCVMKAATTVREGVWRRRRLLSWKTLRKRTHLRPNKRLPQGPHSAALISLNCSPEDSII